MYEWQTLRTVAMVLLCLPLLQFALTISRDFTSYLNPSPEVWNDELQDIIEADREIVMPEQAVLVVGGHRVQLWKELEQVLSPRDTLVRPLGDASLEDLAYHFERLVAFYHPHTLMIVPGYADLHLRDDKTPEEYVNALRDLLALDRAYANTHWRYVIGPLQMPLHPSDTQRIRQMNALSEQLCHAQARTTCIDPNPVLTGVDGRPNPDYYRGDGINLNEAGYARLSFILRGRMTEDGTLSPERGAAH